MRGRLVCQPAIAVLLVAAALPAQEKLEIDGPEPATIRLGDSARAMIRVEGRGADPRTPALPKVDGLQLELGPPSRNSYTFFDGRTLTERIGVQYQLTLRPLRAGTFVVPPFPIWTGTREQTTRELRLDARKDMRGEELGWLEVTVEPKRVYVHEPIRIHVDYGVQQGLRLVQDRHDRYVYFDVEVQAPWLFEFPGGEPIELPPPKGDVKLVLGPRILLPATYQTNHERGGERWQRFTFDRAFLPTRLGKIELSAPTLRYHVLQREGQQDFFGRTGRISDNFYVYGKPITVEVLPIPEAGRPTPYYGAVGRFAIEAALDKDTVAVGSSVKLTLTVTGQGNFEFLRLPPLDELPGFHKLGQTETKREADKVVVSYDLTPLSTEVRAVPPIEWNWFDTTPGVEKFVETSTRELPLVVRPLANGETLAPLPDSGAKAVTPGVDDIFDLPPFDGPDAVSTPVQAPLWWAAVLGPWVLALAGLFGFSAWRRALADKEGQRARSAARTCSKALENREDPTAALAAYLGARIGVPAAAIIAPDLRERLAEAGLDAAAAGEVASLVERGTAARYGGGASLEPAAVQDCVKRLERVRFGVRGWLPLVTWPLLAVLGASGGLSAQATGDDVEADRVAAIAAYRAGDYRAAEAAFTRVFAATGDRRCWQARGNCYYRLGELPAALWAFESARLGLPRDAELAANLRLVRTRLELGADPGGFVAELATLRDQLLPSERLWLCAGCMAIAAGCLVLGWRRVGLRWIGVLAFVPGAWLATEALWLGPMRPPHAIALKPLALVSEPRAGLEPVATVRPGVTVALLGGGQGSFVRVQAGDRSGYAPRESVAVIE